jgi:hypothetical protein
MKRKSFPVVLALAVIALAAYPVVANAGCKNERKRNKTNKVRK